MATPKTTPIKPAKLTIAQKKAMSDKLRAFISDVSPDDAKPIHNAIKRAGGIGACLSAYVKSGNKKFADLGAYAFIFRGIFERFQAGQTVKLAGFAMSSKKDSHIFDALVGIGILAPSGAVVASMNDYTHGLDTLEPMMEDFAIACAVHNAKSKELARVAKSKAEVSETQETQTAPTATVDRVGSAALSNAMHAYFDAVYIAPLSAQSAMCEMRRKVHAHVTAHIETLTLLQEVAALRRALEEATAAPRKAPAKRKAPATV